MDAAVDDVVLLTVVNDTFSIVCVVIIIIIIIMIIFRCYFSRERIALSYKKRFEHRIRKNQQNKSTAHEGKSYLK